MISDFSEIPFFPSPLSGVPLTNQYKSSVPKTSCPPDLPVYTENFASLQS
jgi:hypothetical protein